MNDTKDLKKNFTGDLIKKHKLFFGFITVQLVILFLAFTGLFGEAVNMELDASNLDIADSGVVVNDDKSMYINARSDAEPFGRWIAGMGPFDLREGMYDVSIDYWSLLYDTEVGGNCEDKTGSLQVIRSGEREDKLRYSELVFKDGWESQSTRLWIRDIGGEKGLSVKVCFYGVGELRIDKITIREITAWRFMKLLAWLLAFATADAMAWYFFVSDGAKNKPVVAVLIVSVFFASLPLFTDFLFWGHDIDFHINRIMALADGLSHGNFFVPIQTEALNGYGYATPLFYSQLFLYPPAILYNLGVPIQTCYHIYAFFVNIATALIAYYSFRGIVKDRRIAVTGAVLYLLSAYRMTNLYVRAAVGEYTAMAFFPLIAYGFARVYTRDAKKLGFRDCIPIVIGLSGLVESHVLSCEMSAIFITAMCLVNFKRTFEARRFATLAGAAMLTLCVNMAFIVPFIDSMRMDIKVNNEPVNSIQGHGTYLQQVFAMFQVSSGYSQVWMHDEMPLSLGLSLLLGVGIFLACCAMRREWKVRNDHALNIGMTNTVFTAVCIIFSMRNFPWDSLGNMNKTLAKVLCMIQFPWRYLSMATMSATVATLAGLQIVKRAKGTNVLKFMCVALCFVAFTTNGLYMAYYTNNAPINQVYGGDDVDKALSSAEYIIYGTKEGYLRWRNPRADAGFVRVENYKYDGGITTFACKNTAGVEMAVELPLMNYDNYHAYDVGSGREIGIMNGTDNRVTLAVPPRFDGQVKVLYKFPLLWKISYVISAVSAVFVAVAGILCRRGKGGRRTGAGKKVRTDGL